MLSRAITRSLQTPGLRARTATTSFRIASSQQVWNRSMARHNRPNQNPPQTPSQSQKKTVDASKAPGASPISKAATASAAFNGSQQGQKGGDKSGQASQQEVLNSAASKAQGAGNKNAASDTVYSSKQEEFATSASPSENITPQSSESATNPEEVYTGPLPDLTRGIPSTIEFELNERTRKLPLNLTEAEGPEAEVGGSGRGRGELPASAYVSSSEKRRLRFANIMYGLFAAASVTGTVYLGRNWESEEEEKAHPDAPSGWGFGLMWNRARARMDDQLKHYTDPTFEKLLPDPHPSFERPYTLVLSLEDLLIHSEWTREHGWRLAKRPGMDYFLRYLSQYYELVLWTSQPYGLTEGIIRKLDPFHIITWPLFREATRYENGEYVKDLSFLNRDLSKVILIDTVAAHAKNQPENAIILPKWKGTTDDKELVSLIPFLEYLHTMAYSDVRKALKSFEGTHIPTEFAKREAVARKKFQEQLEEEKKKAPKRSGLSFLSKSLGMKHQNQMVDPNEMTPAEAFAQGKMLQDLARERGQKNYEAMDKEIRENGARWLKEEADMMEKDKEEQMKAMKSGFTGFFGSPKND